MNAKSSISILCSTVLSAAMLTGCTTTETSVADGQSVKTIMAAQVNDAEATARHGTTAPRGTDPEVSNTTVNSVRSRSREGASRPGLFDLLLGGMGRN
ncbi:MAG: hypothetical protein RLZ79_439 [Pseudomonadota bacterium]|jgi:hypothetical protein